ncbi:putative ribonuclease H-like domain-containing protein [Tanacetum coccineum]
MRPFGCPITILNTIDHLGKFDGKADEVFFVGYSLNSKAFRVFNSRTRIVEENLHIRFSESTPNVVGSGLDWLFDIDALTRTMNYKPIVAGTQSNSFAGTKASDNAGQARKETEPVKDYILLPLWTADPPYSQDPKSSHDDGSKPSSDDGKKVDEVQKRYSDSTHQEVRTPKGNSALERGDPSWIEALLEDLLTIQVTRSFRTLVDYKWKKGYSLNRHKGDILLVQVYVDDIIFGSTKNELRISFAKFMHENFQISSMGELTFFLGLQVKQKDGIFISQDIYVAEILKKFGFTKVKTTSTLMETQKPLLKDEMVKKYQVNLKVSHLHAVKMIFSARNRQWLQISQQKLSMWLLQVVVDKLLGINLHKIILLVQEVWGSTSGITPAALSLRNFDLGSMEFESAIVAYAKFPILKTSVKNGNSWCGLFQDCTKEMVTSVTKGMVLVTAKKRTNRRTMRGHRLAILGVVIAQEDLNSKLLSSLPPEWNTYVVVWMNKPKVDTMSIDDQYNNFKIVEQKVKKSIGASSGAQNLAFMTAPNTSSTNDVNTASPQVSTVSTNVNTASPQVSTASFSDNDMYAFMVENPNGSNLLHQDLEHIYEDDLEAMDLKWQLSLLSMRAKRYYQRTGNKIFINANDTAGYDKSKVECFNCHKMGHFTRECKAPRSKEGQFRNQDNIIKQGNNEDTSSKEMLAIDGVGFDWSDMAEEQLDLSYSGLDEFKEPEFKGYGTENSKQESNIVCDKKSDDSKENSDDSLVKEQVSKDTSSFVESSLNVDKEIVFPVDKKVESVKPKNHEKTVKKSVRGFKPALSFMRPFGCHVTILNTLDNLGKFDGKSDEGFFVGYSLSSKAFRVYNTRTRRVEENLHIGFLENKPMIEGNGPKWLFDIDSLTQSMNYVPVAAGTITNESAGTQGELNAGTSTQKEEISQDCIVMPIWKDASYFDSLSKDVGNGEPKSAANDQKHVEDSLDNVKDEKDKSEDDSSPKEVNTVGQHVNTASPEVNTGRFKLNIVDPSVNTASSYDPDSLKDMFKMGSSHTLKATHVEFFNDEDEPEVNLGNILNSYTVPTTPNTRIHKDHPIKNVIGDVKSSVQTRRMTKPTSEQGFLGAVYKEKSYDTLNTCLYACFLSQIEPTSIAKALSDSSWVEVINKKDERGIVIRNKAKLVAQGHRQEEGIDYEEVFAHVVVKALYGLHQAPRAWHETLANYLLGNGFKRGKIDQTLFIKKQKGDILLVHVYVDDIIFGSTNKELCTGFEKLMKDKFQISSMGELTFFLGLQVQQKEDGIFISHDKYVDEILKKFNYTDVKSASTLVDLKKPLVKDVDADDVDVHLYRSMIGFPMYLTASRPDIMFAVCLWYSRDSPFDLIAYTDSDYAGATQDRKSTTKDLLTKSLVKRPVHKDFGDRMGKLPLLALGLESKARILETTIRPNPWQHLM